MDAPYSAQTDSIPARPSTTGSWWRFSGYQIRQAWIVPAADAVLEWYNPWKGFRGGTPRDILRQASLAKQPIYSGLMRLESQLTFHPGVRRYPDCVTEAAQNRSR